MGRNRSLPVVVTLAVLLGCSTRTIAPQLTIVQELDLREDPVLLLPPDPYSDRLAVALEANGVHTTRSVRRSNLVLRSSFGVARGGGECGPVRQARFLVLHGTQPVLHVLARGPTGECPGNVIEASARTIAAALR